MRPASPHLVSNASKAPIPSPHPGRGGVLEAVVLSGFQAGQGSLRGIRGQRWGLSTLLTLAIGESACGLGRFDILRG